MAEYHQEIPLLKEEVTEVFEADANCKGSLDIIVVGKAGSGKSLAILCLLGPNARDVPIVASGVVPVTECTKVYKYPDNNCSVTVTDTRGLFDGQEDGYEQEIAHKLREVCQRDRNGVVLFCIEMFGGRIDKACLTSLAMLHKICGKEIWRYTVIALTKADLFQTAGWESNVLKEKFDEKLREAKDYLRKSFTTCSSTVRSECYIGMTEEEYDTLNIPILPTSVVREDCMKAMKKVGYGCWFDTLLQELCTREKGMMLVKIHSRRLLNLGHVEELLKLDKVKKVLEILASPVMYGGPIQNALGVPLVLGVWKAVSAYSLKVAIEAPRFQKAPVEEQVEEEEDDDNEPSTSKKTSDIITLEKEDNNCVCL